MVGVRIKIAAIVVCCFVAVAFTWRRSVPLSPLSPPLAFAAATPRPTPAPSFATMCWGTEHCSALPAKKCSASLSGEAPVTIIAQEVETGPSSATGKELINADGVISPLVSFTAFTVHAADGTFSTTWSSATLGSQHFFGMVDEKSGEKRMESTDPIRTLICDSEKH